MKWLGQHIVSLIARFRDDVYLEDISSGTIASGGNLGLDSNNKIVKANEPTSHDAVTLAGTPDYITLSGQEITRNQIDLTADVTGVLPVANTAAKVTSIVAGDGIDVSGATGDVTVTAEDASATNPGGGELATTSEADTGTDTARAVTPAGLKSHVDARYHYQYIPLSANATTPTDGDWMYASGNGIGNHLYNQNGAAGGTTASNTDGSASTITISKNAVSGGIMIPYDSILVGFYAQTRAASNLSLIHI